MACGETNTIIRFLNALDVYASGIKWNIEAKGIISPAYLITGKIGNNQFTGYASNLSELPYAIVKVLLGLVVTSIAPALGVETQKEEVNSNAGN